MRTLVVVTRMGWGWQGGIPSEDWVAARESMLARVTVPAVKNVKAPLVWVWLVAPERYEQVREIADRLYPEAILVAHDPDAEAIPGDEFVVARVDSDDAYMPEAMERLAEMELPPKTLVNWRAGWQLDVRGDPVMAERTYPLHVQGPFLAITSEGRENIPAMLLTNGPHGKARRGHDVVHIDERSWIIGIHDLNTSSHWRNLPPITDECRAEVLRRFGI